MIPIQYVSSIVDVSPALMAGCHWIQLSDATSGTISDAELSDTIARCHAASCYLLLTDHVERCMQATADGLLLTTEAIARIAAATPPPSGTVLQSPRPVTLAIHNVRTTMGEDSPMLLGVSVETSEDAVAAARSGADFIQAPAHLASSVLAAVRERSFTTPIVACGVTTADEVIRLIDNGINGVACTSNDVPPVILPLLLNADESF